MTLESVLRDLEPAWGDYLTRKLAENQDAYKKIERDFENFFGTRPAVVNNQFVQIRPETDEIRNAAGENFLMLSLAAVAARTCRPFWRTEREDGKTPRISVLVPVEIPEQKIAAWCRVIGMTANLKQQDVSNDKTVDIVNNKSGVNPYVMVLMTKSGADSLDEVLSIDAWKDPKLQRVLQLADDHTAESMPFRKDLWDDYRGSGFTDPIYIYNEQLRTARWRPWALESRASSGPSAADRELLRALYYGLLGPEWYLRSLNPDLRGDDPLNPVFKRGRFGEIVLRRRPIVFQGGYDPAKPFIFPKKESTVADMPLKDAVLAENLDQLLLRLDPNRNRNQTADLKALRTALLEEYRSFTNRPFAREAGFDPQTPGQAEARTSLMEALKVHINDEEHKEGERAFWREVRIGLED
jgi:hypothetical protein